MAKVGYTLMTEQAGPKELVVTGPRHLYLLRSR